jgi:Protein of unknown function (DUF2029).
MSQVIKSNFPLFRFQNSQLPAGLVNRLHHTTALLPLAALLLYFIVKAITAPLGDYATYYFGSLELWRGNYTTAYDACSLSASAASQGYTVFAVYTPFPPFTALVMAPFLLLPITWSKLIFNIFSATLFLFTLRRSARFFNAPLCLLAALPLVFFIPLRNQILLGQGYLLLAVLLLEGYMAYKKGLFNSAGFLWALAIAFKIFPVCILLFPAFRKQYKQLALCISFGAVCFMLSLWCVGFPSWKYYLFTLMPRLNNGELNDSYTYIFQSAFMLLKNLFVYDAIQNPNPLINNLYLFLIVNIIYKSLILGSAVNVKNDWQAFGAWITASLLISPNGSSYSLILLLIPLIAFPNRIFLLLLICWLPIQWFESFPTIVRFPRLHLMLILFASISKFNLKPILAFIAVFLITHIFQLFPQPDPSRYFFTTNTPLIYKINIRQNHLAYFYWNGSGSHEVITNHLVTTAEEIPIINNQLIHNGHQLTHTPDLKKQAMLINNRQVIYLSDKNRGVGFYTLRVLK